MHISDKIISKHHYLPENRDREDNFIASLDPLDVDERIMQVPNFNNQHNTTELVLLLVDILPSVCCLNTFDVYQTNAAMRDWLAAWFAQKTWLRTC